MRAVAALAGLHLPLLLGVTAVDATTFAVAAVIVLAGAIGVVVSRNPVHSALALVMTLFGVAVLFVEERANFLAAVQVIVYAGAIVVLFLFVIMFLGVDRSEDVAAEPLRFQRPIAVGLVALALIGLLVLAEGARWATGAPSVAGAARGQPGGNVAALGRAVFTTYLFPFEATAALLVIAVVGAVFLSRKPGASRGGPPEAAATEAGTEPEPAPDRDVPGEGSRTGSPTGGESESAGKAEPEYAGNPVGSAPGPSAEPEEVSR